MTLPHDQDLELYHYAESLCSQKARIGMAEKGLAYKSHHIVICDIAAECQNLEADYLRINPKGVVPTLVHRGEPVYDAHRIIKHVDAAYPDSGEKLWPDDPKSQEIASYWFSEGMLDETAAYGSTFGTAIPLLSHPILAHTLGRQPLELVIEKFKNHPIERRGKNFTALRQTGAKPPPEVMDLALTNVAKGLIEVNRLLESSGGPWLLGGFSLPDVTMMACFHRLEDVRLDDLLSHDRIPLVAGYWSRLQARPSYKQAVTDWHDAENFRSAIAEIFDDGKSPRLDRAVEILASLDNL